MEPGAVAHTLTPPFPGEQGTFNVLGLLSVPQSSSSFKICSGFVILSSHLHLNVEQVQPHLFSLWHSVDIWYPWVCPAPATELQAALDRGISVLFSFKWQGHLLRQIYTVPRALGL